MHLKFSVVSQVGQVYSDPVELTRTALSRERGFDMGSGGHTSVREKDETHASKQQGGVLKEGRGLSRLS